MLDYETRKQLEETWLCEMAYTRKKAEQICEDCADLFMVYLCKCFLFSNYKIYYEHWLLECGNFCVLCDNIRLKPKAKRPEKEFFMQDNFICEEIETADDAQGYLNLAIMKCPEIEHDLATNNEAFRFIDLWSVLREKLAEMFSDETVHTRDEFINVIDKYIKENS